MLLEGKVSLKCDLWYIVAALPNTVTGGEAVLEVVNGVAGTLAHSTLYAPLVEFQSRSHIKATDSATVGKTYRLALGGSAVELLTEVVPILIVGSLLDNNLLVVV